MSDSRTPWALAAAGVAFAVVGLYIWRKGGISNAAQAIGAGAVQVAGDVTAGTVGAIGQTVGLPTPDQTVRDPAQARWIIDNVGQWEASKWASAYAYTAAQFMPSGSGTPPPSNSPAGKAFAPYAEAAKWVDYTDDENARLAARYPAQKSNVGIFAGLPADTAEWRPSMFGRRPGEM